MDHPHSRVMTVVGARKRTFAISRRDVPEVWHQLHALSNQRAQGKPDARCTRGPVCNKVVEFAHEHTGPAEAIRLSLRGSLRLIRGLLGELCTFATVARA